MHIIHGSTVRHDYVGVDEGGNGGMQSKYNNWNITKINNP